VRSLSPDRTRVVLEVADLLTIRPFYCRTPTALHQIIFFGGGLCDLLLALVAALLPALGLLFNFSWMIEFRNRLLRIFIQAILRIAVQNSWNEALACSGSFKSSL